MPNCRVCRTHDRGRRLPERDWTFVPGPVRGYSIFQKAHNRHVKCLKIVRQLSGGATDASPFPDLADFQFLSFSTERAIMVSGFEEVEGARYYQGWYIVWD